MKPPAMQFYVKDWKADTDGLCPAAKGAWIQICCTLHLAQKRGRSTHSVDAWGRIIGCRRNEVRALMQEIEDCNCACVTFRNGDITVVSRRMERERKEKEQNALRQAKHRESRKSNKNVTSPSASASASATATTKKQPPKSPVKEGSSGRSKQPKSPMPDVPDYLKEIWPDWVASRKEGKHPLTPRGAELQLKKLAAVSEAEAIRIIEYSIMNGYQGLIFDRQQTAPKKDPVDIYKLLGKERPKEQDDG